MGDEPTSKGRSYHLWKRSRKKSLLSSTKNAKEEEKILSVVRKQVLLAGSVSSNLEGRESWRMKRDSGKLSVSSLEGRKQGERENVPRHTGTNVRLSNDKGVRPARAGRAEPRHGEYPSTPSQKKRSVTWAASAPAR